MARYAMAVVMLWAMPASVAAKNPSPGQACAAGKQKAAGVLAAKYLACWSKAAATAGRVEPACLAKASTKFGASFAKLERKGGCVTPGDEETIGTYIAFVASRIAAGTPAAVEDCTNDMDDNGNGEVDCDDVTCITTPACVETACGDGLDNDGDGSTDCSDLDCLDTAACVESVCSDGLDNDGDGQTDCEDADCFNNSTCNVCGDGIGQGLEACDGTDLRGATCIALGYAGGGSLVCYPFCALDVTGCVQ